MATTWPRRTTVLAGILAGMLVLAGCGGERDTGGGGEGGGEGGGRLAIATGNTTGVYYALGGGLAELITANLDGYEATAEATGASVENIQRVVQGDSDIGFTLADSAADAVNGEASFDEPQPIRALGRIYENFTHVFATADSGIQTVADMAGKRVSTGSPNSGTEVIAGRLLESAGLDPDADIQRQSLGLPETVAAMKDGTVDAMVWSGGLPTGGITDLTTSLGDGVVMISLDDLLPTMQETYGDIYVEATVPADTYGLPADVSTIGVPNLLVVHEEMDEQLAYDLTKLVIEHQPELEQVHPAAAGISPDAAVETGPVELHPGSQRYYDEA